MNKREEEKLKKQQERLEKEIARTKAMSTFEEEYKDYPYICGIGKSYFTRHKNSSIFIIRIIIMYHLTSCKKKRILLSRRTLICTSI